MQDRPPSPSELDRVAGVVDAWADDQAAENPAVMSVERGEPVGRRWYVRLRGDNRDVFAVWFTLRQRTLRYETYFMPAPITNAAELYALLLRRNHGLRALRFSIGEEDAVFVAGETDVSRVSEQELDRILGSVYATVEANFVAAMRIGYEGKFRA